MGQGGNGAVVRLFESSSLDETTLLEGRTSTCPTAARIVCTCPPARCPLRSIPFCCPQAAASPRSASSARRLALVLRAERPDEQRQQHHHDARARTAKCDGCRRLSGCQVRLPPIMSLPRMSKQAGGDRVRVPGGHTRPGDARLQAVGGVWQCAPPSL